MIAEEFIKEYTKGCSNETYEGVYHEWLTPEQALAAVEIARKELIDKAVKFLFDHREEVKTEDNGIAGWIPDELIMDFHKAMKE